MTFMQQPESDRLVQAATADLAAGRISQAAASLASALVADPRHPMALTKLAEVAIIRKDHARALDLTAAALDIEPHFAPALHQRAAALWAAGRPLEAVSAARQAVHVQPPNPEFRLRFAQFAGWTGCGQEARQALAPLLGGPAPYAPAIAMRGELALAEGRFEDAAADLDQALAIQPALGVTRMLRGMNRLRLGQYRAGWTDYAARETIPALYPDDAARSADRIWQGQDLAGKTLLVTDDQGHGDAIQFIRYLPLLRDRGAAQVTWQTFPATVRMFAQSAPYAQVVTGLPDGARFDFQCNSTSLPRSFDTELDTIPAQVPYLRPPSPTPEIRSRKRVKLQVGLVWSGDSRHTRDHLRSIPAEVALTLADVPGASFHSLQHEVRASDRPALTARKAVGRAIERAADFADTAALIADLDLVIAVDTGVAHLAGALGKPVWLILHVAPDWRWLADRADSPWYPATRLFRVTPVEWSAGANWGPVLERVRAALLSAVHDQAVQA